MSPRRNSGDTKKHVTGKQAAKSASKSKSTREKTGNQFPDLEGIFEAFLDAFVLVRVACRLMEEGSQDDYGPVMLVLRQGVDALDAVSDKLERAHIQLRAASKNASGGSAS
jgi:hypothetical protein